jgi:UDP-2,4-diacetamido-2,4,6-trideoxy-beta-L-altropyranose hydrolase
MVAILQNKGHFLFYGNSTSQVGAGHIMRLLALAQYAQEAGFKCTFLYKQCQPSHIKRVHDEGFGTAQLSGLLSPDAFKDLSPTHLIIDDYSLSLHEWQLLKDASVFKIALDDAQSADPIYADLVVNASPSALEAEYRARTKYALLCLGPDYTLLRKEFRVASVVLPELNARKRVLVIMGGTDVKHLSLPICHKLLGLHPELPLSLVLGECTPESEQAVCQLAARYPHFQLYRKPNNVATIMAEAGLALSAAGGSLSELACMNVPTLALVCAENQRGALRSPPNNTWYQALDFSSYGERHDPNADELMIDSLCAQAYELHKNYERRLAMQQQIIGIVDGLGCRRIVEQTGVI